MRNTVQYHTHDHQPQGHGDEQRRIRHALLAQARESLWILAEARGKTRETVRGEAGAEVHATVEMNVAGLVFYLLRAINGTA